MIDAEKLLGKILSGAVASGGKKKKKKRKKSDDFLGSLVGGLTSGKGLITAIGLGVGAYEILKQQSERSPSLPVEGGVTHTSPPAPPSMPSSIVPPPVPGGSVPPPLPGRDGGANRETDGESLAVLLIQTMVAAAHVDGTLDHAEEAKILQRLQEQGLDYEEKQYVLTQLHTPRTIDELVLGVQSPVVAETMYSLAASTIVVDTPQERQWLDELAGKLAISPAMQRFIAEEL